MTTPAKPFRSGFVGIIGRPNVGKSTLVNQLVGQKVAITSPHPQTTRSRILGVLTRDDAQIAFLDSPGWHKPEHALGRSMTEAAKAVLEEADVLIVVIDGRAGLTKEDENLFSRLKAIGKPVILAINKTDIAKKPLLLPLLQRCEATKLFTDFIPISALTGDQTAVLLKRILELLPEGPQWYPPEQRTDQTSEQLTTELIREQVLHATHQEVPHAVAVILTQMQEGPKVLEIEATLIVERNGQKAILIGKGGAMLKRIGEKARKEIEALLGRHIYLGLWVKVEPDWRANAARLREYGLNA